MPRSLILLVSSICFVIACGPSSKREACTGADCMSGTCHPGDARSCYTGPSGTKDVGICAGGMQSCTAAGNWGNCDGEVTPQAEVCNSGIDHACKGAPDSGDADADGDGWTVCGGDCCDNPNVCGNPKEVNPGAYEVAGDGVDNDCNGVVDDAILLCDQGVTSTSTNGLDFASTIDICPTVTLTGAALMSDPLRHWGVIDATLTLADGTGVPNPKAHALLKHYGTGVLPHGGVNLLLMSSGMAAGESDPNYVSSLSSDMGTESNFPADFVAANGGKLPNSPGCPEPLGAKAEDPVMLTIHVRVPTNAHSFSIDSNFFSDEFPEFTCSPYNDFFVVLLDSMYSGMPANPADKNLAFYQSGMNKYPVGVNLASGNTGLFTQCVNGTTGCSGTAGTISSCVGVGDLQGTGLEQPAPFVCDANSLMGGGTGWLTTTGNVKPGEIMTLRIAIWDTSDHILDSMAVIDGFKWSTDSSTPGTVIFRTAGEPPADPLVHDALQSRAR